MNEKQKNAKCTIPKVVSYHKEYLHLAFFFTKSFLWFILFNELVHDNRQYVVTSHL